MDSPGSDQNLVLGSNPLTESIASSRSNVAPLASQSRLSGWLHRAASAILRYFRLSGKDDALGLDLNLEVSREKFKLNLKVRY